MYLVTVWVSDGTGVVFVFSLVTCAGLSYTHFRPCLSPASFNGFHDAPPGRFSVSTALFANLPHFAVLYEPWTTREAAPLNNTRPSLKFARRQNFLSLVSLGRIMSLRTDPATARGQSSPIQTDCGQTPKGRGRCLKEATKERKREDRLPATYPLREPSSGCAGLDEASGQCCVAKLVTLVIWSLRRWSSEAPRALCWRSPNSLL